MKGLFLDKVRLYKYNRMGASQGKKKNNNKPSDGDITLDPETSTALGNQLAQNKGGNK